MGIKQTITKDDLPLKYQAYNLLETTDGVSHSVYLLDDKYVLKIVENDELDALQNEQKLLNELENSCVPILLDIIQQKEYTLAFYTQLQGKTQYTPEQMHIEQIALFLKQFHSISKNLTSTNKNNYSSDRLKLLVEESKNRQLIKYFNTINCKPKKDGIIHGDLFCDNAKFKNETLSGVYDFIEACEGDFTFELAVVSISWCFEEKNINQNKIVTLLETYGLDIKYQDFLEYIKYALLYYATMRFLTQRNYQELLDKLEGI